MRSTTTISSEVKTPGVTKKKILSLCYDDRRTSTSDNDEFTL